MNSPGSTELSEGYPGTSSMALLPRSGSPIAWPTADDIPAMQPAGHWASWADRSAVEVRLTRTMGVLALLGRPMATDGGTLRVHEITMAGREGNLVPLRHRLHLHPPHALPGLMCNSSGVSPESTEIAPLS
jgi:hypothetical protein